MQALTMTLDEIRTTFGWSELPHSRGSFQRGNFPKGTINPITREMEWNREAVYAWARERNLPDPHVLFRARVGAFWKALRQVVFDVADVSGCRVSFSSLYACHCQVRSDRKMLLLHIKGESLIVATSENSTEQLTRDVHPIVLSGAGLAVRLGADEQSVEAFTKDTLMKWLTPVETSLGTLTFNIAAASD